MDYGKIKFHFSVDLNQKDPQLLDRILNWMHFSDNGDVVSIVRHPEEKIRIGRSGGLFEHV